MRYTALSGSPADDLQHPSIQPTSYPWPQCGMKGQRKRVMTRRMAHVAALQRRPWMGAAVGVYQARGACCQYCPASMAGVPSRGRYAWAGRTTGAPAVMRDRMP
jgi:hypothetical protein